MKGLELCGKISKRIKTFCELNAVALEVNLTSVRPSIQKL